MKKSIKVTAIIVCIILIIVGLTPLSLSFLNQEMICYENKADDGFVTKTRYAVIKDYLNGVRYAEVRVYRD